MEIEYILIYFLINTLLTIGMVKYAVATDFKVDSEFPILSEKEFYYGIVFGMLFCLPVIILYNIKNGFSRLTKR